MAGLRMWLHDYWYWKTVEKTYGREGLICGGQGFWCGRWYGSEVWGGKEIWYGREGLICGG